MNLGQQILLKKKYIGLSIRKGMDSFKRGPLS